MTLCLSPRTARFQPRDAYSGRLALVLPLFVQLLACTKAPPNAKSAVLDASFTYEGKPYPAKLTVVADHPSGRPLRTESTGDRALLAISGTATLTIDARLPPDRGDSVVFRDIIPHFTVPLGETLHVQFTLPTPASRVPFAPTLLMSGRNAAATVSNDLVRGPDGRVTLTSTVRADPGTSIILDGHYFGLDAPGGLDDTTARDFVCAEPCAHLFPQGVDCSFHCVTCSTTQKLVGNVFTGNFNMCEIRAPSSGGDPIAVTSTFMRLAAGDGGVHTSVLLRVGRATAPTRLALARVAGDARSALAVPNVAQRYPEFVATAGDYQYEVTAPGDSSESLRLPIAIADGQVTLLHVELPTAASLAVHEPVVVADTRLGLVRRESAARKTADGVRLDVTAHGPDVGTAWLLLPLATDSRIRGISVQEDSGAARPLREGTDFLSQTVGTRQAVIVRSSARRASFAMQLSSDRPQVP